MAVYVTSDAHGHVRALDEALGQISLASDDVLYVLGDLIDRGPDPLGVVRLVRSLPQARVLLGNHEQLMLLATARTGAPVNGEFDLSHLGVDEFTNWFDWMNNGGNATATQLGQLSHEDYVEYLSWVSGLPLYDAVEAGGHTFALVHAGINAGVVSDYCEAHPGANLCDPLTLRDLLGCHSADDLLWMREGLAYPTRLVGADGRGPVVVAGHTPTPLLAKLAALPEEACMTSERQGKVVLYGACEATAGHADRIDVDCAAASGAGMGRVGILRLDDLSCFYASIKEGE